MIIFSSLFEEQYLVQKPHMTNPTHTARPPQTIKEKIFSRLKNTGENISQNFGKYAAGAAGLALAGGLAYGAKQSYDHAEEQKAAEQSKIQLLINRIENSVNDLRTAIGQKLSKEEIENYKATALNLIEQAYSMIQSISDEWVPVIREKLDHLKIVVEQLYQQFTNSMDYQLKNVGHTLRVNW